MKRLWSIIVSMTLLNMFITLMPVCATNTAVDTANLKASIATMSKTAEALRQNHLEVMEQAFDGKLHYRQMQNAVTVTPVSELALNRSRASSMIGRSPPSIKPVVAGCSRAQTYCGWLR
jgi:hypothetical protein